MNLGSPVAYMCQLHFQSACETKNASAQGSLKFLTDTKKVLGEK